VFWARVTPARGTPIRCREVRVLTRHEAFWTARRASPNRSARERVRVGRVGGGSCLAAVAGFSCRGGARRATENVRGWATRERLFQLTGAEGQRSVSQACERRRLGEMIRRGRSSPKLAEANDSATRSGSGQRELGGPRQVPTLETVIPGSWWHPRPRSRQPCCCGVGRAAPTVDR